MTAIDEMVRQPMAQAVGWALLQFLWQGTLIGACAAVLLTLLRRSAADVRYVVATVALALMLTVPVVTALQAFSAGQGLKTLPLQAGSGGAGHGLKTLPLQAGSGGAGQGLEALPLQAGSSGAAQGLKTPDDGKPSAATTAVGPGLQTRPIDAWQSVATPSPEPGLPTLPDGSARASVEPWLPMLVSVWLAGVGMLTLRLLSGWIWVQRMKSRDARPVHETIETLGHRLMRRLHIGRAVRFLESARVDVPTVIGWFRPVILLPVSALAGLAPRQVEAILAHELAHIRRHDYLVNLLQVVVETLLFYHPAVWWLSRRIRVEREHCCDDLAVSLCGDPVTYAAALAELEGLRSPRGELVLAATGGSLLHRVRRVLGAPSHAGRAPGWLAGTVAVLVMAALSASVVNTSVPADRGRAVVSDDAQIVASTPVPVRPAAVTSPPQATAAVSNPEAPAPVLASMSPAQAAAVQPAMAATPPAEADAVMSRAAEAALAPVAPAASSVESIAAAMAATPSSPRPVAAAEAGARSVAEAVVASMPARAQSPNGQSSGNFSWSDTFEKVEITYRGDIEFTADDTDVARMSPGATLRITDGRRWFGSDTTVEFTADQSGNIQRRFQVGWSERPFEPEGRKWLSAILPRFIRQSGIGAPARVARIHKSSGVTGVLAEISRIEGGWAKRRYFTELLKLGLSAGDVQRALTQAGAEIDSDFELASLLISSNQVIADDGARRAYLDAARSIESDFEMHRVLSSILKSGVVATSIATSLLDASASIDSDFEEASLLVDFARQQPFDAAVRAPFFKALGTVGSAFEHGRVLQTVLRRTDLSSEVGAAVLESAATIGSDFETATVLEQFVKSNPVEGMTRAPFFRAAGSIDSAFERGRVLQALARRSDLSDDTVLEILRSAQGINANYERAQVLLAVAAGHVLTGQGRDAYIDAAEKLGTYEQGRTLSALVKNERRSPAR